MVRFVEFYLWKACWLMLAVLLLSLVALLLALWGVSMVEQDLGRQTAFDIEVRVLGDAPLWVLLQAGMLVMNGLAMTRWALMTADVGRRRMGYGYEINLPFPLAKIAAANVLYIGLAVIAFYALRSAV